MLILLAGLIAAYFLVMRTGISTWGRGSGDEPYSFYPTAAQLSDRVQALASKYPELITVHEIGTTLQGKPLLGVSIAAPGTQPADSRPALLVIAQQHGREAIANQVALYSMEALLREYVSNPVVKHLLSSRTIYYVPQANPDGNDIFLTSDSTHRGNARTADLDSDGEFSEDSRDAAGAGTFGRHIVKFTDEWISQTAGNVFSDNWSERDENGKYKHARGYWTLGYVNERGTAIKQLDNDGDGKVNEDDLVGVDLNRNWDLEWEQGISDPKSLTYRGSKPFSEPEAAAIRDFVLAHPNIFAAAEYHSGADVILMPWSKTRDELPPEYHILDLLARKSSQLTKSQHTVASQGLYLAYGTIKDWLYDQGILTLVPEVYRGPYYSGVRRLWPTNYYIAYGSSAQQFNPPPREIKQHAERWQQIAPYLLSALPDPYMANIRLANQKLRLEVGNSGLIGCNLRLTLFMGNTRVFSSTWTAVSQAKHNVTIPLARDGAYQLVLVSQPDIKIRQRQPQELLLSFQVAHGIIEGLDDMPAPPDVSTLFGTAR